jgi:hypothetical protein
MAEMDLKINIIPESKKLEDRLNRLKKLGVPIGAGITPAKEEDKEENKDRKKSNSLLGDILKAMGIMKISSTLLSGLVTLVEPFVRLFSALSFLVFFPLWKYLKPVLEKLASGVKEIAERGLLETIAGPTPREREGMIEGEEIKKSFLDIYPNIATVILGGFVAVMGAIVAFLVGSIPLTFSLILAGLVTLAPRLSEMVAEKFGSFWAVLFKLVLAVGVGIVAAALGGWIVALVGLMIATFALFLPELSKVGKFIFDSIVSNVKMGLSILRDLGGMIMGFIRRFIGGGRGGGGERVSDAIITPTGKVITTSPEDYLIATKTPEKLGVGAGGMTFSPTININAQINSEMDIRKVAEQIAEIGAEELSRKTGSGRF